MVSLSGGDDCGEIDMRKELALLAAIAALFTFVAFGA
jgi:hypothetical protein